MIAFRIILLISGCLGFIASVAYYLYVKVKLRPRDELDDYYYEFEENCPALRDYEQKLSLAITTAAVSMLAIFLAAVL